MALYKWYTNKTQPTEFQIFSLDQSAEETTFKILDMLWNSSSDTFMCKVNASANHDFTKINQFYQIESIYDPLSLLKP